MLINKALFGPECEPSTVLYSTQYLSVPVSFFCAAHLLGSTQRRRAYGGRSSVVMVFAHLSGSHRDKRRSTSHHQVSKMASI